MSKMHFRQRRERPLEAFGAGFEAAVHQFSTDFLKSAVFHNASSKGTERELPVQQFLQEHLPHAFGVRKGEAVDIRGKTSPQLDVMVFDRSRNVAFQEGNSEIVLPAEALLVSIEVKSMLTSGEIESILVAARRLYQLKPFKKNLVSRRLGGAPADGSARFFHCVFAYGSDLIPQNWVEQEYKRFVRIGLELGISPNLVERVYVANRGLSNLSNHSGLTEEVGQGTALMQFYMHVLNFLSRENERRKAVPYIEYAGKMNRGWKNL
jgi:hypothetical protein